MVAKSHRFSMKSVMNEVYLAKIDGKYWRNGRDGYFYLDQYSDKLTVVDAYQKMQSGYSWNHRQLCYRRYYRGVAQGLFSSIPKKSKILR